MAKLTEEQFNQTVQWVKQLGNTPLSLDILRKGFQQLSTFKSQRGKNRNLLFTEFCGLAVIFQISPSKIKNLGEFSSGFAATYSTSGHINFQSTLICPARTSSDTDDSYAKKLLEPINLISRCSAKGPESNRKSVFFTKKKVFLPDNLIEQFNTLETQFSSLVMDTRCNELGFFNIRATALSSAQIDNLQKTAYQLVEQAINYAKSMRKQGKSLPLSVCDFFRHICIAPSPLLACQTSYWQLHVLKQPRRYSQILALLRQKEVRGLFLNVNENENPLTKFTTAEQFLDKNRIITIISNVPQIERKLALLNDAVQHIHTAMGSEQPNYKQQQNLHDLQEAFYYVVKKYSQNIADLQQILGQYSAIFDDRNPLDLQDMLENQLNMYLTRSSVATVN